MLKRKAEPIDKHVCPWLWPMGNRSNNDQSYHIQSTYQYLSYTLLDGSYHTLSCGGKERPLEIFPYDLYASRISLIN